MFLEDRRVERLLNLIRTINLTPPWKDTQGFLDSLNRLVPFDRSVAFMKVDPATHQIIPSPYTVTNLSAVDSLQDHNSYFWKFKRPIIDRLTEQKFLSFHVPTTFSIALPKPQFQEYRIDYWDRYKIRFCYACYIKTPQGYLATYLSRSGSGQDFSEEERKILDLLSPHLESVAAEIGSESTTLFADAKGSILWTDAQTEMILKENPAFASQIHHSLPVWLGLLAQNPLKPFQAEVRAKGTRYTFNVSQSGFGRFPLYRVCWNSKEESPLPPATLDAFTRKYRLSPREKELLELAVGGKQTKEMAERLGLALDTVKEYLSSLYRKAGVDGRGTLVAKVLSQTSFQPQEAPKI